MAIGRGNYDAIEHLGLVCRKVDVIAVANVAFLSDSQTIIIYRGEHLEKWIEKCSPSTPGVRKRCTVWPYYESVAVYIGDFVSQTLETGNM